MNKIPDIISPSLSSISSQSRSLPTFSVPGEDFPKPSGENTLNNISNIYLDNTKLVNVNCQLYKTSCISWYLILTLCAKENQIILDSAHETLRSGVATFHLVCSIKLAKYITWFIYKYCETYLANPKYQDIFTFVPIIG